MNGKVRQYVLNINRVVIFLLIVISIVFDDNLSAILAAAYWLWLPNITKIEFNLLDTKLKKSSKG